MQLSSKPLVSFLIAAALVIGLMAGALLFANEPITMTMTTTATITEPVAEKITQTKTTTETVKEGRATITVVSTYWTTEKITETERITYTITKTESITITEKIGGVVRDVCFSPAGRCSTLLINLFNNAKKSIYVLIYSFTLDDVADALIEASRRGVDVKIVIESDNAYSRGSEYTRLLENGIAVRLDSNPYQMHHKVAIIDGEIVITGSMNWSFSGDTRNDENIIVIEDRDVAARYLNEFNRIWNLAS